MRPSGDEVTAVERSADETGLVVKEPCRSMLKIRPPDSSCLLYWSRRQKASRTDELPLFTQVGNRALDEPMWDVSAW